jgi:hypothetical protein
VTEQPTNDATATSSSPADGELVSALSVVESQPLETRAEGYAKMYDELRAQLEGGDLPTRD